MGPMSGDPPDPDARAEWIGKEETLRMTQPLGFVRAVVDRDSCMADLLSSELVNIGEVSRSVACRFCLYQVLQIDDVYNNIIDCHLFF
jgi:hypothetical protein